MKLFYNLSNLKDSTTFKHDAQLIKGVQVGIFIFLCLSSLTVFSGIQTHLSNYLASSFFLWRWFVSLCAYVFGSLGIDLVNTVCLAYVVSAILRKDFGKESIFLMGCCAALSIGLTIYSFSMSQNSAVVLGYDMETENQKDDSSELTRIDTSLNNRLESIEANYSINYSRTAEPYKLEIDNITTTYGNQIAILQNEIAVIDDNSTKDNYLYAAKQKKPITAKIQALEAAKLAALSSVQKAQQTALNELTIQKTKEIESARKFHESDRNRTTSKTDKHNDQVSATSSVFSNLFSKLSGYSVFCLLLLAAIREVLFFRNKIEPKPILSNFDFSPSWMSEVVSYPFVWMRRKSVNKVREWYEGLPELKEPVIQKVIWDGESLTQSIASPRTANDLDQIPTIAPVAAPRHKKAKEAISVSIPATSGEGDPVKENSLSQYSHEKAKFGGMDTHENDMISKKKGTHEPTKREPHKIKHIGKDDQVYWYDKKQVEGKVKKYTANVREWSKKANRNKASNRDKKAFENNSQLLKYWKLRLTEF